ncbi:MAG: PAS domain S-box protein [Nitrospirae bacterium]|nr:PAS domain S-box protein [Nitrospirota bacterium]
MRNKEKTREQLIADLQQAQDELQQAQAKIERLEGIQEIYSQGNAIRDMTGHKAMETAMQQELALQRSIAKVTEALLNPKYDKYAISRVVHEEALRLTESEHGYASLTDDSTGDNVAINLTSMMDKECLIAEAQKTAKFPKGPNGYNALWGHSLNTGESFYANYPREHKAFKGCASDGHIEIKNFLSVPVKIGDKIVGQIALANSIRDYTERDLSIISRLASIYGVAIDRKVIEDSLRASEYKFRAIFEQAPLGFAIVAAQTGRFIQVNQTYCNIVGYSEDEMLSLTFQEITYPDDIQSGLDNLKRMIGGKIPIFNTEKRYITKDARVVWVNLKCSPLWIDEGKPLYNLAIVEDITQEKQMSEALRIERDNLNGIMGTIEDGIYIVNRSHDIEFANMAILREFGEVNGRKCYEYLHDRTVPCPLCKNEEVFSGKSVTWEWYFPKNHKIYSLFATPIKNIDGSVSKFEMFHDISDIKNAQLIRKRELDVQAAIAEVSEALLANETDIVDISIIVNRQAMRLTGSKHGCVSEIDRTMGGNVGHACTDMIKDGQCSVATRHSKLPFAKGKDGYNALWGHALNMKQGFYTNNPKEHPSYKGCIPEGHVPLTRYITVPSIIKGNLIGQIALANAERDYTDEDLDVIKRLAAIYAIAVDRKRMEEDLRLANEFSESIIDTAQAIILVLGKHAEIIRINPYMEELSGYTLEEIKGKNWFETFLPERDWLHISQIFEQAIGDIQIHGNVNPIVTKEGREILIEWYAKTLKDKNNEIVGVLSIGQDITERKRMEEELKDLNANLELKVATETESRQRHEQMLIQQSKMAAMGEMIALIAHQWKQPLSALSLYLYNIEDAYKYNELNWEFINNIVTSSMDQILFMSKTMDDFRNFFKPSKEKVTFDVKVAIVELISMFIDIFNKNDIVIEIKDNQCPELPVEGYPNEVKQVILNILSNSKDAIIVRRNTETIHGHIDIAFSKDGDSNDIIVSIRDNGGGIPKDVIGRIFEPYYTTKGSEGTGIGLYMSKTIIETNMGGSLTARNIDGGAEFVITLPSCC